MSKAVHAIGLERIELERLHLRVGELFAALQEALEDTSAPVPGAWSPLVDLCESHESVIVRVELPGVPVEQIEVALTSAQLRISGRKKKRSAPRGHRVHLCSERIYGQFSRVVPLRWPIHVSEATAQLRHGVLTVFLPKLRERRGEQFMVPITELDEH